MCLSAFAVRSLATYHVSRSVETACFAVQRSALGMEIAAWEREQAFKKSTKQSRRTLHSLHCAALSCGQLATHQTVQRTVLSRPSYSVLRDGAVWCTRYCISFMIRADVYDAGIFMGRNGSLIRKFVGNGNYHRGMGVCGPKTHSRRRLADSERALSGHVNTRLAIAYGVHPTTDDTAVS